MNEGEKSMQYDLPDEETLAKYMALLQRVLITAKNSTDPEVAELAYAVHNLPDLLLRWPDMDERNQAESLRRFEARYPDGLDTSRPFSTPAPLRTGS